MRHVHLLVALTLMGACKTPEAKKGPVADPTAAPTASNSALASSPARPATTFKSVVVVAKAQDLDFHPAGSRALITLGRASWGYATAGHAWTRDEHLLDGLPTTGKARIQALGGSWPDIAAVTGEKELAEYAGPRSVLFTRHGATMTASSAAFEDVPRAVVISKGVAYSFVPSSMHFIGGRDSSLCGQSAPVDVPALAIRGDKILAPPKAVPSFHAQSIEDDASGNGFIAGADHCRPGVFIASLDVSPLHLELVPDSDACKERGDTEGMPFTHARFFPSAKGGLFALLVNAPASTYNPDEATRRTGACARPPRVVERLANGTWGSARVLPENARYVDPAGTAWGITDHRTVVRIAEAGSSEIALDATCAGDITGLVVPFADQPWIFVTAGDHVGLCVANVDVL